MRVQGGNPEAISQKYQDYTAKREILIQTWSTLSAQPDFKDKDQLSEWLQTALDDLAEFEKSIDTYLDNPAANQVTLDDISGSCPTIQKTPNLSRATSIVSSTATNASEKLKLAKARHTARQQLKLKRQNLESAQFDENQRHSQESLLQEQRQKQESLLYEQRQKQELLAYEQRQKQDYLLHERAQFEIKQQQDDLELEQEGLELHFMEQALELPVISDVLVEHSPERLMSLTWRSQQLEVGIPPQRI